MIDRLSINKQQIVCPHCDNMDDIKVEAHYESDWGDVDSYLWFFCNDCKKEFTINNMYLGEC